MATEGQRRRRRRQRARRRAANAAQRNQAVRPAQGQARQAALPQSAPTRNRGRRGRRGQGSNPYLETLLEPSRVPGVKIPDADSFPSATFFTTLDTTLTTDATGRVAFAITPAITSGILTGAWNNGTGRFDWTVASFGSSTALQNAFGRARPVSAEVTVEFIGTTQNDSGMISGYLVPRGRAVSSTFTSAISQFTSATVPLKQGIRLVYKPTDNDDFVYHASNVAGFANGPDYNPQVGSGLALYVEGAQASTTVALVRVHANFEGIASNDTFGMVTMETSPTSVGMFEQALSWVSSIPAAQPLALPVVNAAAAGLAGAAGLYAQRAFRPGAIGWGDLV